MKKIKCDNIDYRKGYVEVGSGIHDGYINIEMWDISPEADLKNTDIDDENFQDNYIQGNTEIEMSISEANDLVSRLKKAISEVESSNNKT